MTRKETIQQIYKTGNSLVITVPKRIEKQLGLKKGDEIRVIFEKMMTDKEEMVEAAKRILQEARKDNSGEWI